MYVSGTSSFREALPRIDGHKVHLAHKSAHALFVDGIVLLAENHCHGLHARRRMVKVILFYYLHYPQIETGFALRLVIEVAAVELHVL